MVNFSLSEWLKLIPRNKGWNVSRKARKAS
ncbi:MAG: hypothetical protein JWN70_7004, partial [Planctomycetaceae bacterium]|nr:hypothetical protein [Planctomycetaceae bacterium]